ncbi:hypothetical protein MED222_20179 [Vibrio sp. MED222]|nr:hypothetical protein MED222_20179 [Vibrio sp. MED222]
MCCLLVTALIFFYLRHLSHFHQIEFKENNFLQFKQNKANMAKFFSQILAKLEAYQLQRIPTLDQENAYVH